MKPDFLDELEKQLVEAMEHGRRARVRIWLARIRPGRSVMFGLGGTAVVMSTAAMMVLLAGPEAGARSKTPGLRTSQRGQPPTHPAQITGAGRYAADVDPVKAAHEGAQHKTHVGAITIQGAIAAGKAALIPETGVATQMVPTRFQPQSFTAISELTWWLLGTNSCNHRRCLSIVRTTDGGRRFVRIPAPRTRNVGQLRFASSQIGYAFGNELWTTHDAGQRWTRVRTGGSIDQLSTAGGYVFALIHHHSQHWLVRSPIGLDSWHRVPVPGGEPFTGLWTQANEVFVETAQPLHIRGHRRSVIRHSLAISTDNGFHFSSAKRLPSVGRCQINASLPNIWLHCAVGGRTATWHSGDAGARFRAAGGHGRRNVVVSFQNIGQRSSFGAASAFTAVDGTRQLYRTDDGGRSYARVRTPRGVRAWEYLGFTDPTHGVALGRFADGQQRLYYTTDGGRSYHYVPISG